MISGAGFSECRAYRYALWRRWDWQGYANQVMFVGLNPSTADETEDDPTIRRCIRFAKDWGCGSLLMLNAYAWRATKPRDLHAYGGYADAIGPDNDEALAYRASQAGLIVAAWGYSNDNTNGRAGRPECQRTPTTGRLAFFRTPLTE